MRHRQLGKLFAIAEDAKLGFPTEHFASTDQAGLAALESGAVILQDLSGLDGKFRRRIGHHYSWMNWVYVLQLYQDHT